MRRFVQSLAAVLGIAALGACNGGGSVLNVGGTPNPTAVIVTVQSPQNIARVVPGGSLPISALGVIGSQNGATYTGQFRWSAALVPTGGTYFVTPGVSRACAAVTITPTGGSATPYFADFSLYITIDPTNEQNILFAPPPVVPSPTGTTVSAPYPYCVVVSATAMNGGAVGSITVAVVDPQNPLQ